MSSDFLLFSLKQDVHLFMCVNFIIDFFSLSKKQMFSISAFILL